MNKIRIQTQYQHVTLHDFSTTAQIKDKTGRAWPRTVFMQH
jgi:hypothetical protein